jgi:nucleotide-binding universal stress UspA family protein
VHSVRAAGTASAEGARPIMEAKQQRPYTIVVGIDYSEASPRVLSEVFALAAQRQGSEPHIIHVAAPSGNLTDGFAAVNLEQAAKQLEAYVQTEVTKYAEQNAGNIGFDRVCAHQRVGAAADEIAQLATDLEADLVMVGSHSRRGIERLLLGSVAERVVRIAPCPVLVVRPKEASNVPKIEPVCPQCLETRKSTEGKEVWCARHRERHARAHTYHYVHRNVKQSNLPMIEPLTRG